MRVYKHLNPDKVDANPEHSTRARVVSSADVRTWLVVTGQTQGNDVAVTATFIVDTEGWLWIADRHSEHFACASGRDVLAAGEMIFDIDRYSVIVSDVTNQSLGYCPEPDSWSAVASALDHADIDHPGRFTSEFVFRQCSECGTKNVIKDGSYECAVCGSSLSQTWNLVSSFSSPPPRPDTSASSTATAPVNPMKIAVPYIIRATDALHELVADFDHDFADLLLLPQLWRHEEGGTTSWGHEIVKLLFLGNLVDKYEGHPGFDDVFSNVDLTAKLFDQFWTLESIVFDESSRSVEEHLPVETIDKLKPSDNLLVQSWLEFLKKTASNR